MTDIDGGTFVTRGDVILLLKNIGFGYDSRMKKIEDRLDRCEWESETAFLKRRVLQLQAQLERSNIQPEYPE